MLARIFWVNSLGQLLNFLLLTAHFYYFGLCGRHKFDELNILFESWRADHLPILLLQQFGPFAGILKIAALCFEVHIEPPFASVLRFSEDVLAQKTHLLLLVKHQFQERQKAFVRGGDLLKISEAGNCGSVRRL